MAEPTRAELADRLAEVERDRSKIQDELWSAQEAHRKAREYVEEIVACALPDSESTALAGCIAALERLRRDLEALATQQRHSSRAFATNPGTDPFWRILAHLAARYGAPQAICPPGLTVRFELAPEPEEVINGYQEWRPAHEQAHYEVRPI